jgi:CRP-like cAMP-binding protein
MQLSEQQREFLQQKFRELVAFSDEELAGIIACFKCREVARQDFLLKEGEVCDFWGFVYEGLILSYTFTDTGEEYVSGFIKDGSSISESTSFFERTPGTVLCRALEDTTILYITYNELQQLYDRYPAFDKYARMSYERRLIGLKKRLLYRVQLDATSRYLHFASHYEDLLQRVPLKYIASYLSITDSTLSRIRRKLAKSNFLPFVKQ